MGERVGTTSASNSKFALWINKTSFKEAINFGTYDSGYDTSDITNANVRNVTSNIRANMYYNGIFVRGDNTAEFTTGELSIYLFALNSSGTLDNRNCVVKLYRYKLYENDVLVRDFVPVYRKSDNVAGLYDTINDVFYINQGTGSFTVGANISPWQHSLRKLGTATDTITILPAVVYADGTNATVGLKGNMSQTGTPTPSSPIQPQECGDLETTGAHAGQYKTPISSASTTTPVYLGEVQTTRRIRKLVLTGDEDWYFINAYAATNAFYRFNLSYGQTVIPTYIDKCTHYEGKQIDDSSATGIGCCAQYISNNDVSCIAIRPYAETTYGELNTFKAYLASQYAAGTPVTVWYVLATETTGIVNEPIRKIGDYADTVSGITIPTITGKDTFDVETTLKPSEIELTYTGWHDATVKEWDGSDWS